MDENTDENGALERIANLMKFVRSKDLGQDIPESEGSGEFVETPGNEYMDSITENQPCFSVFPPTTKFDRIHIHIKHHLLSTWKKFYFEDLAEMSNFRPQFGITELIVNSTMDVNAEVRDSGFYDRVVVNLLNVLPAIHRIQLGGGYRFESESVDLHDLIDHFANLHENFVQIISLLKQRGIEVQFDNYAVELTIPEQVVYEFDNNTLKESLDAVFHPFSAKWSQKEAEIEFKVKGVQTNLMVIVGSPFTKRKFAPRCVKVVKNPADISKEVAYREAGFNENTTVSVTETSTQSQLNEDCIEEVFEAGTQSLSFDNLYVEDFVNLTNFEPQTQLKSLNLSVSVANRLYSTHEKFYEHAVESLKRAAPNLKFVGLYGALRHYPFIPNLPELRNEFMEIKRSIEAMSRAMTQAFERVEWIEPPIFVFSLEKEVMKRLQGGDIVKAVDIFNYSDLEIFDGRVNIKFTTENETPHDLVLVLLPFYPQGYTPF
ncbi:hypothetical protein M3Y96_01157600 [Aphelenchoides besseyi]|nr:hypothetical protein M3Y96_01157600 [Aphelenchoides besseyi]